MLGKKVEKLQKEGTLPEMMFNGLLVTAEKRKAKSDIIITGVTDSVYSDIQEVVKVGDLVKNIEVGDLVLIKVENFKKRGTNSIREDVIKEYHEVELPIRDFGTKEYMPITDRDIHYYWKAKEVTV